MSGPIADLAVLRRHFDGTERELRILCHEEARVRSCLEGLRESATKEVIRGALDELQHRVRCQRSSFARRRMELEEAEHATLASQETS